MHRVRQPRVCLCTFFEQGPEGQHRMQFDVGNVKLLFAFIYVALLLLDSYLTELQPELGVTRCWIFDFI